MITTTLRTYATVINGTMFHFSATLFTTPHGDDCRFQITAETVLAPFCRVVYESLGSLEWCVEQVECVRGDYLDSGDAYRWENCAADYARQLERQNREFFKDSIC